MQMLAMQKNNLQLAHLVKAFFNLLTVGWVLTGARLILQGADIWSNLNTKSAC